MEITLSSGIKIGDGHKPFIICEIGSNWTNQNDCLDAILKAKQCGADAVKFQLYSFQDLFGFSGTARGELPAEWLPILKEKADRVGIEFMCTPFSPDRVRQVDPFVNIHKIASSEATHIRILEAVRDTGKPVILSTGAKGERDILTAQHVLKPSPQVLLYCVASYPAREVDLRCIPHMRNHYGSLVGYSDHTTDVIMIPRLACDLGASVIEKHVTFIEQETPDSPHSLKFEEFQTMCHAINGELSLKAHYTKEETPMIKKHNRRLIALKDIREGDRLFEGENVGIFRSLHEDTHAYSPFMIDQVVGKTALKDIPVGFGVGPGDINTLEK